MQLYQTCHYEAITSLAAYSASKPMLKELSGFPDNNYPREPYDGHEDGV